jgi:hypothetical protein
MPDLHDLAPEVDTDAAWHIFERVARQRRTRRRVVAALATVAVVAATIAVVTLETNKSGNRGVQVVGQPTVPHSANPPQGHSPPPGRCRSGQLSASGSWQGAGGTMGGTIYFSDVSASACVLSGRPSVQLLGTNGERLPVGSTDFVDAPATVVLGPHVTRGAMVAIVWSNWCGSRTPVVVEVTLPRTTHTMKVTDEGFSSRPRCDNPGAPSGIAIGNFQTSGVASATRPTTTTPRCPGPPVTLPAGGQSVLPVSVPCDCPQEPITPIPQSDIARTGPVADAALRWARNVNPKWRGVGNVTALYAVGDTSQGQFGDVYALNVRRFCGESVASASYVVEMFNAAENDTGREADAVVAHFAGGWQVWGSFHP